jgi:hypothetical protein
MYSAQGIIQHNFQCKKVHTILDKIQYLASGFINSLCLLLTDGAAKQSGIVLHISGINITQLFFFIIGALVQNP